VERVHPTRFIQDQINYWGALKNGWFNTLFTQKEMITTTAGHSYVFADGIPYFYSGLTSITNDESTVGFMLVNLRTKEATFYPITGATETAAIKSAQGQVQQFGYQASDPILVNEFGAATYFMTLKDVDGLLKQYAFVSVENYNIVGVGNSISEARNNYYTVLKSNGILSKADDVATAIKGTVERINFIEGNYYIKLSGKNELYSIPKTVSPKLALTQVGDKIEIQYGTEVNGFYEVTEFINKTLK